MRGDRIRWVGLMVAVLAILVFSKLTVEHEFPTFEFAGPPIELVEDDIAVIGAEVSRFLWENRVIDMIAQAFILFVAAVCCMVILRTEGEKE